MEFLTEINKYIESTLNSVGLFAPFLASVLIATEALIPLLPLAVFITINFEVLGFTGGLLVSWLFTVVGCYLVFKLSKLKFKSWFERKMLEKHKRLFRKLFTRINDLKLEQLALLLAIPFIPSLVLNATSGIAGVADKKYIIALLFGKLFEVGFWGILGTSILDSFENPQNLIIICTLMSLVFLITRIINKKYKID